jgi:hypothetical protein
MMRSTVLSLPLQLVFPGVTKELERTGNTVAIVINFTVTVSYSRKLLIMSKTGVNVIKNFMYST